MVYLNSYKFKSEKGRPLVDPQWMLGRHDSTESRNGRHNFAKSHEKIV